MIGPIDSLVDAAWASGTSFDSANCADDNVRDNMRPDPVGPGLIVSHAHDNGDAR